MMQENYLISIKGTQKLDGDSGEITLTTLGSYIIKDENRFIIYKEYDPDNSRVSTTSILKVDQGNTVTLMRGGAGHTRLVLEQGKRHLCQYDTGFGSMMVGIFTSKVRSRLDEKGGKLEMRYTLDINSGLNSVNEILITVKEAENKDVKISAASN